MRLFFLIRSLDPGGAERQLTALANGLAARGHEVHVAVLYSGGGLERDLDGPTLHHLGKTGRWDLAGCMVRLVRLVRDLAPDVVHGYLGTANLLLALAKPFLRRAKVAWGVRASTMDLNQYSLLHRLHWKAEGLLSPLADRIIYNSEAGRKHAERSGFKKEHGTVIPNGIDTDHFRPDPEGGKRMRERWSVPADARLIGLPARLDPMKDHPTFLRAAARLAGQREDVRFVCIGDGPLRAKMQALAAKLDLNDRLVWAGHVSDMPAAYSALDLCCLSSAFGEGFPNVLGEAMACSVPCVATDVGDVRRILGDTGAMVEPGDPVVLAAALDVMVGKTGTESQSGQSCRERIVNGFDQALLLSQTETALAALPESGKPEPPRQ